MATHSKCAPCTISTDVSRMLKIEGIGRLSTQRTPTVNVVLPIVEVRVGIEGKVIQFASTLYAQRMGHQVRSLKLGN